MNLIVFILVNGPVNIYLIENWLFLSKATTKGIVLSSKAGINKYLKSADQSIFLYYLLFVKFRILDGYRFKFITCAFSQLAHL